MLPLTTTTSPISALTMLSRVITSSTDRTLPLAATRFGVLSLSQHLISYLKSSVFELEFEF